MASNFYTDWKPGVTYSFASVAPGILPINYTRVKLVGTNQFNIARQIAGEDLLSQWREVYPHLPAGTPDTPNASTWFTFMSMGGEPITVAEQWIDGSTVTVTNFINYDIMVTEGSTVQLARIRDLLNQEDVKYAIILKD